jgi:uncharacterized protein
MRHESYHHQHKKRLMISWKEYGKMVKDLAKKVADEFDPDCIIGNSKGGCIIGGTIAAILRKDFYPMRISRRIKDEIVFTKPKIAVIPSVNLSGKRILLVDDIAVSGETIKIAVKLLKKKKPREIKILTLARHKNSFMPDFCGLTSDGCIVFPWDRWIYINGRFKIHPELSVRNK